MIYYDIREDWVTNLEGPHRAPFAETLRGLRLQRLQKYPPPKLGGLPFGNETRVAERFLRGESAQLDASALHKFYLGFADEEEQLLYRAFRQNEALSREDWSEMIGADRVDKWVKHKFLRHTDDDKFACRFSVISLDGLALLVDPMNDHGGEHHESVALPAGYKPENGDSADENIQQFNHTYIGLDSLRQIDTMVTGTTQNGGRVRRGKRYLDCGPGAGALLLYFSRKFDEAVGVDINQRSVTLSRFNAELNNLDNITVHEGSALDLENKYGRFDLISWNLPFMFMPDIGAEENVDAFGGELGIGLCLEFINELPKLLNEDGLAVIAALSPIMQTDENVLETRLQERIADLGLDCTVRVTQVSLAHTKEMWDFHQSHNVKKFESVYLYFKPGKGEFKRIDPPASRKMLDKIRERMYRKKFA